MQNLSAKDFYKPCKWNPETKNQVWMSEIADAHDNFCGCDTPFAHLLASIFPPNHRDRNNTIQQILDRDYKQCLSGGPEEESHGLQIGDSAATINIKREENLIGDEELDTLLAAAATAAEKDER